MALRDDWSPSDSTELWNHFNYISKGVNEIGQTARYWFGQGRGAAPDKNVSAQFASGENIAPDLNIAGGMYVRSTTMANPPVRLSNGRRFTFPEPGPYRLEWRVNWEATSRPGYVWAGILLNPVDSGQNLMGALTGVILDEEAYPCNRYTMDPDGLDAFVGATARARIDYDFEEGDTFMCVTRQKTGGSLGLRFFETWTSLQVTRIGH